MLSKVPVPVLETKYNPAEGMLVLILGLFFVLLSREGDGKSGLVTLAVPLAVYLLPPSVLCPRGGGVCGQPRGISRLRAARNTDHGRLDVTNTGETLDEVQVEDVLPGGMNRLDGSSSTVCALASGGKIELEYTIAASRGAYEHYAVRLCQGCPAPV